MQQPFRIRRSIRQSTLRLTAVGNHQVRTNMSDDRGPFWKMLDILSKFLGILGLSNLAQSTVDDLMAWKGFLGTIFDAYRMVIGAAWYFLTGWLPIAIPVWIADYLVVGSLYLTCLRITYQHGVGIVSSSLVVLMWPPMLAATVFTAVTGRGPHDPTMEAYVLQWALTIVVGSALLLSFNGLLLWAPDFRLSFD